MSKAPALLDPKISKIAGNVQKILEARYLQKDNNGKIIETADEMFWRVANAVAKAEESDEKKFWAEEFYNLMASNKFLPNSPTLMNAGTGAGTLSACFVIGIEDSMQSILYAAHKAGMVLKYGGGVGYYLGELRPKGSPIKTTHGKACGPVAVLRFLNAVSQLITQGGKRDGANMAILPVWHPDIREFIHCKDENIGASEKNQVISNFNISVSVNDEFMQAVNKNEQYSLREPHTNKVVGAINAKELFDEITQSAWATGDPGLYFFDNVNRHNPTPHLGELKTTNPCGEVPLYNEEACNLGSINLNAFIVDGHLDFKSLYETSKVATRFLDNVVTVNQFPLQEIRDAVNKTRKLGLGIMGLADIFLTLKIPYDSDEALVLSDQIMSTIQKAGHETSQELAEIRGVYPAWHGSKHEKLGIKMRNATVTCIAPTGTISRIAGASSGIEPVFAFVTESKILRGQLSESVIDYHPEYEKVVINGKIPEELQRVFITTNEISHEWHIKHQAIFQKYTDLSVSKTINFPNSATVEDIRKSYLLAEGLNCMGITIYRDGSRQFQILNKVTESKTEPKKIELSIDDLKDREDPVTLADRKIKLGDEVEGKRYKVPTPLGINARVQIFEDENDLAREVTILLGKSGTDIQADAEAIGRLISLARSYGIPLEEIQQQLDGITSGRFVHYKGEVITSVPDAIAYGLSRYIKSSENGNGNGKPGLIEHNVNKLLRTANYEYCPDCNNQLVMEEACMKCSNPSCAFSRC